VTLAVVVLASGAGSLMQALIDAQADSKNYEVVALVTDNPNAFVISRAASAGIEIAVIALNDFSSRSDWNQALADAVGYFKPDLVVSAGFMRIVGEPMITQFAGRFINAHPALLPDFPGAHAVHDALRAGVDETGTTVHFVDAGVDTGQIIDQVPVPVFADDTEAILHERIKSVERDLLVEVVTKFAEMKLAGVF
jgi:phosphoribosylglycinamide formyltransferase 1